MEIVIDRKYRKKSYTVSNLYVDGQWMCNVLERPDRRLDSSMPLKRILEGKVKGKTAIPSGKYKVTLDVQSGKFSSDPAYQWCRGFLPRVIGVPGFSGILFHAGNKAADSRGCLLVGLNTSKGRLTSSMKSLKKLYSKMQCCPDDIRLTVACISNNKTTTRYESQNPHHHAARAPRPI
jgi:hypothetical protein